MEKNLSILAILLMLVGLVLTLENFGFIDGISRLWPIFMIILSIGFMILFYQRKKNPALAWLSTTLTLLGIFFFYLNYTSWINLATNWPIFLGIFGLSFLVSGILVKKKIHLYIAIIFIILFLTLFFVFTIYLSLWPLILVLFGLSLLIIDYFPIKKKK
jgi:hypothetical protein